MIVSEEEAKTKWCPQAAVLAEVTYSDGRPAGADASFNRFQDAEKVLPLGCHCVASKCMLWTFAEHAPGGYCGLRGRHPSDVEPRNA